MNGERIGLALDTVPQDVDIMDSATSRTIAYGLPPKKEQSMSNKQRKRKPNKKVNAGLMGVIGLLLVITGIVFANGNNSATDAPVIINNTAVAPLPPLDDARAAEGETLYMQHCSECHGVDLKGSPTWKEPLADGSYPPPPQDDSGHTWHHSDAQLIELIQNGGDPDFNSKMPAFKDKLTENQIVSILEFFKSNWSKDSREFQWWISVRPE